MAAKRNFDRLDIVRWLQTVPYSPTIREIQKAVDLGSPSSVHHHLNTLTRDGYIAYEGERMYLTRKGKRVKRDTVPV